MPFPLKAQKTSPDKKDKRGYRDGPQERDDTPPDNDGCATGDQMDPADDKTSGKKSKGPPAGFPPKHQPPGSSKAKQFALRK